MDISRAALLNNGVWMPLLGLGVYQVPPGPQTQKVVEEALQVGYRHIDTAAAYRNEKDVGLALKASGLPRREVFITTKLARADHGREPTRRAFEYSLKQLQLDKVDLYLIHWPGSPVRKESWRAMEAIHEEGLCRAIGVSNYTAKHLKELLAYCKVRPTVNQVEFSPFLYQKDLLKLCQANEVQLVAYSPLTRGKRLDFPGLVEIAHKISRTPAQVLLRWAIEHGVAIIPKSTHRNRMGENAKVFDFQLEAEDLAIMDTWNQGLRTCWDPSQVA